VVCGHSLAAQKSASRGLRETCDALADPCRATGALRHHDADRGRRCGSVAASWGRSARPQRRLVVLTGAAHPGATVISIADAASSKLFDSTRWTRDRAVWRTGPAPGRSGGLGRGQPGAVPPTSASFRHGRGRDVSIHSLLLRPERRLRRRRWHSDQSKSLRCASGSERRGLGILAAIRRQENPPRWPSDVPGSHRAQAARDRRPTNQREQDQKGAIGLRGPHAMSVKHRDGGLSLLGELSDHFASAVGL
jgi:hypothetical protein